MAKKKKLTYWERRKQEDKVNVKAIIWVGSITAAVIILLSVLIVLGV